MKKIFLVAFPLSIALVVASCTLDTPPPAASGGQAGTSGAAGAPSSAGTSGAVAGRPGSGGSGAGLGGDGAGGQSGEGGEAGGGEIPTECPADKKLCDGSCVAISDPAYGCDPTLCSASRCPDAAGAMLACDAGECVIAECGAGNKKCAAACVSVTDPAFGCGAESCDASTCPSQATGATLACQQGACVIGSCPSGYKKCDGKCVAVSDPTYGCGATSCDATACPAVGAGTVVCQAGACVLGSCGAGTKNCNGKCVTTDANNGCAEAARCTACASNEACQGSPTTCECVPTVKATACMGKCGSVPNGCGGMHVCGTCTSPQSCGGSGTANVCGCTNTPQATACAGKTCGSAPNGCGGTYSCGSCMSASAPICVSNACKECGAVSDCAAGYFACTSNNCVCRPPSSANLLTNPGFDGSAQPWAAVASYSGGNDADDCAESGSLSLMGTSGQEGQCLSAVANGDYFMTFRFKSTGGGTGYCGVNFFSAAGCDGNNLENSFETSVSGPAGTWRQAMITTAKASANAVSLKFYCSSAIGGSGYYDQMYLGRTSGTF